MRVPILERRGAVLALLALGVLVTPVTASPEAGLPLPTVHQSPLPTKHVLTLEAAERVADAAQAEAERNGWAVSIAVLDDGGQLLLFRRLDGAKLVATDIAIRKARTAVHFQGPTKDLEAEVAGGRTALLPIDDFMPLEGGIPLVYQGHMVGAIGVSGVTGAQDAQCALAGADALEAQG